LASRGCGTYNAEHLNIAVMGGIILSKGRTRGIRRKEPCWVGGGPSLIRPTGEKSKTL